MVRNKRAGRHVVVTPKGVFLMHYLWYIHQLDLANCWVIVLKPGSYGMADPFNIPGNWVSRPFWLVLDGETNLQEGNHGLNAQLFQMER